jgi:4-diphosphocytidyl-2-C-methyl-D-erythritol kinase
MIQLEARAKINLTLDVLYQRSDGYHQVETIMQSITLADTLVLETGPPGEIKFLCSRADLEGPENLVVKAARLLQSYYRQGGARITLGKNIPVAAGLAGGSADAAATLIGLNLLWKLQLGSQELLRLASLLGSDVPFCLKGGTVLARGRGEQIESLRPAPLFSVLLALPEGIPLSTAVVYGSLNLADVKHRPNREIFLQSLYRRDLQSMSLAMANILEEVVLPRWEEVRKLKDQMLSFTPCALMSGSGPTVFGLFLEKKDALMAKQLLQLEGYTAFLSETAPEINYKGDG